VAVKKSTGRWSGTKKSGSASAGKKTAESDRKLQREAEQRRQRTQASKPKKQGAVQSGERTYPEPPLPKQHLEKPGLETELEPRPRYEAPEYRGSGKLEGRVALVTGGDSGIGRAVAVLFAREGADVAIVYLSEDEDAEETRRAVEAEGRRALLIPGDVTSSAFCQEAVESTVQEFGQLDILVNNAAFQEHAASLEDITDEQLDRTFRTNIFGYFYMARAALPHLGEGAAIINTGSVTGLQGSKELLDYSSTKGAIHAFTKSLAQNVVERGIRVNCVAPGPVWTPLNPADQDAEKVAQFGSSVAMKRPAQPEELAPSYVFLAAPVCSSYITGEILPVLGGMEGG
jgi:NAD(P)-dependent dehydrogenase (short-subunit alcohol dehydrogenase family)